MITAQQSPQYDGGVYLPIDPAFYNGGTATEREIARAGYIPALAGMVGKAPCEGCPYQAECMEGKACADFYAYVWEWDASLSCSQQIISRAGGPSGRVPLPEIYKSIYTRDYIFHASEAMRNDWDRAGEYYALS